MSSHLLARRLLAETLLVWSYNLEKAGRFLMGHIFISYSHKNTEYAHTLADSLQSRGFEVWIDARLDYGSQWPHEIQNIWIRVMRFS